VSGEGEGEGGGGGGGGGESSGGESSDDELGPLDDAVYQSTILYLRKAIEAYETNQESDWDRNIFLLRTNFSPNPHLDHLQPLLDEITQGFGFSSPETRPLLARLMIEIKKVFGKQHDIQRKDYTAKAYKEWEDAQQGIKRKEIGKGDYDDPDDDDYYSD
jgi:hypothetical protein